VGFSPKSKNTNNKTWRHLRQAVYKGRKMGDESSNPTAEGLEKALLDLVIESWRFTKLFQRLLTKVDAGEGTRYINQYRYYLKRLDDCLSQAGFHVANIEGHPYDAGMAASALNIGDFGPDDVLLVDQMVEPIIMGPDGLVRSGTVMLRKVAE